MSLPTVSPGVALAADLRKTKIVHLIRHGAALHNIYARDYGYQMYLDERLFDAPLHPTGVKQAESLSKTVFPSPHVILVSPLTRTLQTADAYTGGICSGKTPKSPETPRVIALEVVREAYGRNPCDRRRKVSELKEEWPGVDFESGMRTDADECWTSERETVDSVARRAGELLRYICSVEEQVIAVISHGVFLETFTSTALSALTGMHAAHSSLCDHRFTNCEVRSLVLFVPDTVPCVNAVRRQPREAVDPQTHVPPPQRMQETHTTTSEAPGNPTSADAAASQVNAEEKEETTSPEQQQGPSSTENDVTQPTTATTKSDKSPKSSSPPSTSQADTAHSDMAISSITLEDLAGAEWAASGDGSPLRTSLDLNTSEANEESEVRKTKEGDENMGSPSAP